MSQFTIQLRNIESFVGREELKSWFMDYDLHDYLTDSQIYVIEARGVWSKEKLAELIIDHYYMREIGLETPALFKLKVKTALKEIMEEKAPLIWSASLDINPFKEFEINSESTSTGSSTVNTSGDSLNIHSNTPQGQINKSEILSGKYASDTNGTENTNRSEGKDSSNNISKSTGRNRSEMSLIREYRQNILMINREIVNDLAELFIGIY